jgi:uncharacterized protein
MGNPKRPAYAVCGAAAADRLAFYQTFCKTPHSLRVTFGGDTDGTNASQSVLRIPADAPPLAAGEAVAEALRQAPFDSIWLDWPDDRPVDALLSLFQAESLARRCRLKKIVRCAGGAENAAIPGDPDGPAARQLSQCDLFVTGENDRRTIRKLRRSLLPLQPNIEVVSREDRGEVAAVLYGRNVLQGVRFAFVLLAVAALLATLNRLQFSVPDSLAVFLGTYLQALPFLLLGILLSSVIQVFVPAGFLQRVFPKNLLGGMLFGVLGGFILPVCDCASVPVFRSLVRKGVPLPAAVTFMIAAPIINPVVMLSTYYAFGANPRVMLARMGFGVVCSVLVGLCFAWDRRDALLPGAAAPTCACGCGHDHDHDHEHEHEHGHEHAHDHDPGDLRPRRDGKAKLLALLTHFREEFFEVARFLLIGIGVSTLLQIMMGNRLTNLDFSNLAVGMLVMMALAFFLSLCSSSDAVVGKNMGASLPMGAVMSFMVFGPMIDVKNVILMSGSFTKRFMVKLLIVTFAVSFVTVYAAFALGLGALIA